MEIRTRWLVVAVLVPLLLGPACYAIGLNTMPENIALQWAGILFGFTGEGAICLLSIRFDQEPSDLVVKARERVVGFG